MIKSLTSIRLLFLFIFLCCAGSLSTAFFLEYVLHWEPCVLCWVQRGLFALTGIICLLAVLQNPQNVGRRLYAFCALIFSCLGILAAGRQIWLKFNPQGFSCLPTTIVDIFKDNALSQALIKAFEGTPECGLFQGAVLGIELPVWGLILFTVFTIILVYQLFRS